MNLTAAWQALWGPPPRDDGRLAAYPPPFPRGWYRLTGADLRAGEVREVRAFDRSFVVFRGEDGAVGALDATCPHLGAHLGDGTVVGGCLRCPFHGWTFRPDGAVDHVPGARRAPRARAVAYELRERDGMILVWWDGAGPGPAAYEPEVHADVADGRLTFRGESAWGDVQMHLVEFAENSVDFAHFDVLHGQMTLPWTRIPLPGLRVHHHARWERDPARPWVSWFHDAAHLRLFGRPIPRSGATVRILMDGPGGLVSFRFTLPDLGDILLYQTHLPVGPLTQRVGFRWYADRGIPSALVSYVVGTWVSQWRADLGIWERKRYLPKPVLCEADGPVHALRAWYGQFYAAGPGDPPSGTS